MSDSKRESVMALPSDRAVVNGANELSPPLRASVPSAAAYRGWSISFDYGYYRAVGPNYDASYEGEEDGWVDNGEKVEARTLEGLHAEIDEWFDSQVATCPACNGSGFGSQDMCGFCGGAGGVPAQAIEARRAATGTGAVYESAVGEADAPETPSEGISNIKDKTDGSVC